MVCHVSCRIFSDATSSLCRNLLLLLCLDSKKAMAIDTDKSVVIIASLVPRPSHVFQCFTRKIGKAWSISGSPHIIGTAMCAIYGIRPSSARRFIDSVQGRMQSFVLKSLRSKTTAIACSNLAHLCTISLMVSPEEVVHASR